MRFASRGSTVVCFAVLVVLAASHFAEPLSNDQSLFALGAQAMAGGAVLYRDFWDLKQPGIYDFFYVARLGENGPLAVHVLETLVLVLFAAAATAAFSRSRTFRAVAPLAATCGIALYLAVAELHVQFQVEALAGVPLFVLAWLACEGARAKDPRAAAACSVGAGVAAGLALALKVVFLPLVCAIYVLGAFVPGDGARRDRRRSLGSSALALAGASVTIAIVLWPIVRGGALDLALTTWFDVPPRIVATLPHQNPSVLIDGAYWFVRAFGVAFGFGAFGVVMLVRRAELDPLARTLGTWIVVGVPTILAQRTSWWDYQWMLLAVPLGAFAAAGFAIAWQSAPRARIAVALLALVLAIGPLHATERRIALLVKHRFALAAADRESYRDDAFVDYGPVVRDAAKLPPHSSVYVFGTPMYYLVAKRPQPIAINGWSADLLLPEERVELLREFRARRPDYVYIADTDMGCAAVARRYPAFAAYFSSHYEVADRSDFGTLYGPIRRPVR